MKRTAQRSVVSGQKGERRGERGEGDCPNFRLSENGTVPFVARQISKSRAFTLIELLVTITIIAILTGMVFGGLSMVRETAAAAATRATIAKLNNIIMRRYESYATRRVPVNLTGLAPSKATQDRLYAIRDLIRMEMPDRQSDIDDNPITLPNSGASIPRPALSKLYQMYITKAGTSVGPPCFEAETLYMIVSQGSPEAMEQFSQAEIGDTDKNGLPEFLDGWGNPIFFLRWAPAFSQYSDIQQADVAKCHDPFDPRRFDSNAFRLVPLIYSAGPDGKYGINTKSKCQFSKTKGDMFPDSNFKEIGAASAGDGSLTDYQDNITNHHIEVR
jgi:prepilin-type N-terminal cleavage/methylation domain-containing protein